MTPERWLLERAIALLEALMHERGRRPVVWLPPDGVTLREVERAALIAALDATGWVQNAAARKLGITARVINYKMKVHHLHRENPLRPGRPRVYHLRAERPKPVPRRRRRRA